MLRPVSSSAFLAQVPPRTPLSSLWRPTVEPSCSGVKDARGRRRLCLVTLATGAQRWFDPLDGPGFDVTAAMSSDGRTIATITTDESPGRRNTVDSSIVAVDLIDMATATRRRLWSTPGTTGDSVVSWSPDGRLIAASYLTLDEQYQTVVLNPDDRSVRRYDGGSLPFAPNGVWLGDREFVYFTLHGGPFTAHLDHGDRLLPLPQPLRLEEHGLPMAFVGDRMVWVAPLFQHSESADVVTTNLDGSDPRTIVTARPPRTITFVDIARFVDTP